MNHLPRVQSVWLLKHVADWCHFFRSLATFDLETIGIEADL